MLRHGGWLSQDNPFMIYLQNYGWTAVLAFHVVILIKAFQDSVFQGMLCLLVPGYSLVYLFTVSDDFYMRGVLAGLLVPVAWDTLVKLQIVLAWLYKFINEWIQGGALKGG
jgi:hypothetical protein